MKLNKIIEMTAYAVGGLSLFLVSFLVFALAAGVPANEVALLGGLFPEPPAPVAAPEDGEQGDEGARVKLQPKTPEQLIEETVGRLPVYTARSPFQDGEVDAVIGDLKSVKLEYTQKLQELEKLEAELDARQLAQDEKAALLQEIQDRLDAQQGEIVLARQELARDQAVADEADAEKFKKIAAVFGDKKAAVTQMAPRLAMYAPEDAARILANIADEKRRNELLNALDPESFTEFLDAYSALGY